LPRLAVLSVLSAASSPCPDLNLIHYIKILCPIPFLKRRTSLISSTFFSISV